MDLFKVTCVTCRARLSVRDAALIGQIVACPRCGMMVQVTAPKEAIATATSTAGSAVASTATLREVTAPSGGMVEVADVAAAPSATPADPTASTLASAAIFEHAATVLSGGEAALPEGPTGVAVPPPATIPLTPTPPSASSQLGAYKFAAIILGGALAGSALVVGALTWFNRDVDNQSQASIAAASPPRSKVDGPAPSPSSSPHEIAPHLGANSPDDLAAPAANGAEDVDSIPSAPPVFPEGHDEVELTAQPAASQTASANATVESPAAATPEEPAPPAASEVLGAPAADASATHPAGSSGDIEQPRLRIDPLDIDPEGLNLATLYSGEPQDPLAESNLPEQKHRDEHPSAPPAAAAPAPPPAVLQAVRRDAEAGIGAPASTAPLLARKLPHVKITKMPLCQLLDFASQASGIPVSVPPKELRMAGVSAYTTASAEMAEATIEQVLTAALKPLRLEPVIAEEQIILRRIGEDKGRAVDYAVDDLVQNDGEVRRLAQWVELLVAPKSWQSAGGTGSLRVSSKTIHVEHAESVQYDILLLLERYRIARGLTPRSKYPVALIRPSSPTLALAERLKAPAVFSFTEYTPIRAVFAYWQAELGIAVLVDWPALAHERIWPNARIACSIADKPWDEAMDEVLGTLGLGWRAIDDRTVQITTLARVQDEQVVEVYRVGSETAIDAAELESRLQQAKDEVEQNEGSSEAVPAFVAYDEAAHVLLVRQPASAHRRMVSALREMFDYADR